MRKKFLLLTSVICLASSVAFSSCGLIERKASVKSEIETTKKAKKNKKSDDEEETTKKRTHLKEKDDDEKVTTSKKDSDEEKETDEEETTKKDDKKDNKKSDVKIPDGYTEYSGKGYTIAVGSGWSKLSSSTGNLQFSHMGTATNGFAENINVTTQDTSAYDIDLDGYKDISMEQYKQLGYAVTKTNKMTINGNDGYYLEIDGVQSGVDFKIMQFFTLKDDTAYIVTFASDETDYEGLKEEVMNIFNTFSIE